MHLPRSNRSIRFSEGARGNRFWLKSGFPANIRYFLVLSRRLREGWCFSMGASPRMAKS